MRKFLSLFVILLGFWTAAGRPEDGNGKYITNKAAMALIDCLQSANFSLSSDFMDIQTEKGLAVISFCLERTKELRPLVVVVNTYRQNFFESKKDEICGIPMKNGSDPMVADLQKRLTDTRLPFCQLAIENVLPDICALRHICSGDQREIEGMFAVFYSVQQYFRQHLKPFHCETENDGDPMAKMINPKAYDADFDIVEDSILQSEIPCDVQWKFE